MNRVNCLFIGGAKDGQWMVVEEWRKWVEIPIRKSQPLLMRVGEAPLSDAVEIKYEIYQAVRLGGEKTKFTVYALKGMTGDEVMAALINGYKKTDENLRFEAKGF